MLLQFLLHYEIIGSNYIFHICSIHIYPVQFIMQKKKSDADRRFKFIPCYFLLVSGLALTLVFISLHFFFHNYICNKDTFILLTKDFAIHKIMIIKDSFPNVLFTLLFLSKVLVFRVVEIIRLIAQN